MSEVPGTGRSATAPAPNRRLRLWLLGLLALLMPVSKVVVVAGKEMNLSLADPVLLAACFYLGYRFLRRGLRTPMLALFLLNLATVVLSSLVNMDLTLLSHGPVSVLVECFKIVNLWINVYVVVNCVESRRDFLLFLRVWIVGGAIVGLLGSAGSLAYQFGGIETSFSLQFRAQGTFGDANLFAAHLALCFFLTLVYQRLIGRIPFWTLVVAALQLAGIVLSASRGGMLAMTLGLIFLWLFASSLRTKLATLAVGAVALVLLAMVPNRQQILQSNPVTARLDTTTTNLSSPEAAQRKALWVLALHHFLESPLVGYGRGNLGVDSHSLGPEEDYAHNTYLGLLADVGVIGFLIYVLVGVRAISTLGRAAWRLRGQRTGQVALLMLAGLVTLCLCGVTINLENYRGLWMFLGLTESFRLLYGDEVAAAVARGAGAGSGPVAAGWGTR